MSQIFHRHTNIYARLSILAIAVVAAGLGGAAFFTALKSAWKK